MATYTPDSLVDAYQYVIERASRRSGPARTVALLAAQCCLAAALLGPYDHPTFYDDAALPSWVVPSDQPDWPDPNDP